jgi:hypothetical protein
VQIPVRQTQSDLDLDAWQLPRSGPSLFTEELAQFKQSDPHTRSLAVGQLTREILHP